MQARQAFSGPTETHEPALPGAADAASNEPYPVGIDVEDAKDESGKAGVVSGSATVRASSPWRCWWWWRFRCWHSVASWPTSTTTTSSWQFRIRLGSNIGLALLFTVLSFAALSIYDRQALALVGHKVPFSYVALTSFCAYAVGNIAGFGPLTGGTVRYRFYSPLGVSPEDVARIVGYVTAAFGFGLLFVTGLGLLMADAKLAALVGLPAIAVRVTAIAILAFVGAVFIAATVGPQQVTVFGHRVATSRHRERSLCNLSRRCRI